LPINPKYYSRQDAARKWGRTLYSSLMGLVVLCFACFDVLPLTQSFDMFFKLLQKFKTHHQKGGRRI
jgi:hypothetical protein